MSAPERVQIGGVRGNPMTSTGAAQQRRVASAAATAARAAKNGSASEAATAASSSPAAAPAAAAAAASSLPPDHDAAASRASRELRRVRNSPVFRLGLGILIAAAVMATLVVREERLRVIDAPTVRVDLDAGHALRGYSAARTSEEAAAERAAPLQAGGARALSAAHAGSETGVVAPFDDRAPSAHIPLGSIVNVPGMHDSQVWRRQSAALLSAAIYTAFSVDARADARDILERALGGRCILSVINAEHGIFSLVDGSIATNVTTFSPRNELTYETVLLECISFAGAIAHRKTLRLALPHHMPSAHFVSAFETASSDDYGPLRAVAAFWMQTNSYAFRDYRPHLEGRYSGAHFDGEIAPFSRAGDAVILHAALSQEGFVFASDEAAMEAAFKLRVDPSARLVACGTCGYADFLHEGVVYTEVSLAALARRGAFTPSPALFAKYLAINPHYRRARSIVSVATGRAPVVVTLQMRQSLRRSVNFMSSLKLKEYATALRVPHCLHIITARRKRREPQQFSECTTSATQCAR